MGLAETSNPVRLCKHVNSKIRQVLACAKSRIEGSIASVFSNNKHSILWRSLMANPGPKQDKLLAWLAGLGLPLSIAFVGWLVTTTIESSKLDSEYVKIALGILAAQTKDKDGKLIEPTSEELALKNWAVRLLDLRSPEKFSSDEKLALISQKQRLLGSSALAFPGGGSLMWSSPVGPLKFSFDAKPEVGQKGDAIQRFQFQMGTAF
jgi:hypothetical protein